MSKNKQVQNRQVQKQQQKLSSNERAMNQKNKELNTIKGVSSKSSPPPKKKGLFGSSSGTVPKTAQETIPYKHMYKDGICVLPDDRYNKTITFLDINYQLAQPEDQQRIFDKYCKFLNYFDPAVDVQLSFVNKYGNPLDMEKSINIPSAEDDIEYLRKEFREMLKRQLEKGNNGLVKHKYITFTITAKDLKEAKTRLERMETDIIQSLKVMDVRAWSLNGKERIQLLHSQLHPGGDKVVFNWKDLARTGMSTKDIIAPSSFDFKSTRDFKVGNMYGAAYHLQILSTELPDDMLKDFLNIETSLNVTIHLKSIAQDAAVKHVKRKITDVGSMKITEQKKAVRSGYDMDILPPDIITYGDDAQALLSELQQRNERMFLITIIVMPLTKTENDLKNALQTAVGIAQKENCMLKPLDFQQEQGLVSSLVIGKNEIEIKRRVTTSSAAVFVPFTTSELFQEGITMYYGLNALSNNLIMCNRKNLTNPNGLILGIPGTGKSFSAKREIFNVIMVTQDDIIAIDPEDEYAPSIKAVGGQIIDLSQNSPHRINPLDIHEDYAADEKGSDPVALKSNFILSLCELIIGGKDGGLEPEEKSIIDRCVREMYVQYFSDPSPEKMPILKDLYDLLLARAEEGNNAAKYVSSALELYVTGSLNMFNHRTNVNLNNRVVCFNIKNLQSHLKKIGMLVLQDAVWGRVSANREQTKSTWFYIDEFHLLLKDPQTAAYSTEIWKRFRKWGGIPTGITQNVEDFLISSEAENIFKNTPFVYMLGQAQSDRKLLARALDITDEQLSYVKSQEPGEGLLFFGGVTLPFLDKFPKDTQLYKLMTTRPDEVEKG